MNINRSLLTKQAKFLASSFVIVLMIALCILIHLQQAAHANRIDDPAPGSTGSENTINTPATPPALATVEDNFPPVPTLPIPETLPISGLLPVSGSLPTPQDLPTQTTP